MPFLRQEGRLLRARRAYTRMQNVTHWFLVGYILGCRWWYMRVVRVVSLVGCKDYLSSHELSSLTYITPNESWNALCSLYAGGVLWVRGPSPFPSPKGRGVITEIPLWAGCRLRVAPCSASTIAETLCELCMPEAFCGLETCAKSSVNSVRSVREKTTQQLSSIFSHMEGAYFFSQNNTE